LAEVWQFGLMMTAKPSALAECHNGTFGSSLLIAICIPCLFLSFSPLRDVIFS